LVPNQASTSEPSLTRFQCALLVITAASGDGVSPYMIEQWIKSGTGGLLGRSSAHMYRQIKILADRGYLGATREDRSPRKRAATFYVVTKKGNDAAQAWLETTIAQLPPTDDSELVPRVRALRFASDKVVWGGLEDLVFQVGNRLADIDAEEREMRRSGQWTSSVSDRLEIGLSRHLLHAYEAWLDDVMRELNQENPMYR
jgi:DNA-binding PadR family transcriptional regulator